MKLVELLKFLLAGIIVNVTTNRVKAMEPINDLDIPSIDQNTSFTDNPYGLNRIQIANIILQHRKFRSQVIPTAANMKFIEWNRELAELAYNWSRTCENKHGMTKSSRGPMGQNIWWGHEKLMAKATYKWYSEFANYDYETNKCLKGKICGHYTGIAWANVREIGCGANACNKVKTMLVCNYFPHFNIYPHKPYVEGPPCTKCDTEIDSRCYQNTCLTKEQCLRHDLKCKCNMVCLNCGELNEEECSCKCKSGWDGAECSKPCSNLDYKLCAKSPGCDDDSLIKTKKCRKFCGQCKEVDLSNPGDLCCEGAMCNKYESLNKTCSCVPLDQARREAYEFKRASVSSEGPTEKVSVPNQAEKIPTLPDDSNGKKLSTSSDKDFPPSPPNGSTLIKGTIAMVIWIVLLIRF